VCDSETTTSWNCPTREAVPSAQEAQAVYGKHSFMAPRDAKHWRRMSTAGNLDKGAVRSVPLALRST
jgi:hypothetical protein